VTGIEPKGKESGNKLRVNSVGLCTPAPASCERPYLHGRHWSGDDAFCFERFPELPFLSADRFKASDGLFIAGKIRDGRVTF
jgi:hypothetical protein